MTAHFCGLLPFRNFCRISVFRGSDEKMIAFSSYFDYQMDGVRTGVSLIRALENFLMLTQYLWSIPYNCVNTKVDLERNLKS